MTRRRTRINEAGCRLRSPNLPNGDIDWICSTHGVLAVLRDPNLRGLHNLRRQDLACPISEPQFAGPNDPICEACGLALPNHFRACPYHDTALIKVASAALSKHLKVTS